MLIDLTISVWSKLSVPGHLRFVWQRCMQPFVLPPRPLHACMHGCRSCSYPREAPSLACSLPSATAKFTSRCEHACPSLSKVWESETQQVEFSGMMDHVCVSLSQQRGERGARQGTHGPMDACRPFCFFLSAQRHLYVAISWSRILVSCMKHACVL